MIVDHWGGKTLLDVACTVQLDNTETIKYLVSKGSDVLGCAEEVQTTCLHMAAGAGKAAAVEFLVLVGADPLAKDRNGLTALTWAVGLMQSFAGGAATAGHVASLEYLLSLRKLGCPLDIDAEDREGHTALGWAIKLGHTAVATCLRRHGAKHEGWAAARPSARKGQDNSSAKQQAAKEAQATFDAAATLDSISERLAARSANGKVAAEMTAEGAKYGLAPIAPYDTGPRAPSKPECDACGTAGASLRCSRCNSV